MAPKRSARRPATNTPLERRLRLAARRRIVIVHAGAAAGKSRAIRRHLATHDGAHALFTARFEHADAAAFARGLAEALEPLAPHLLRLLPIAFSNARLRPEPWVAVARWFGEQLTIAATIALDELHRLDEASSAWSFITALVDATGPNVRWILGVRGTALLPLPRWLASAEGDTSIDDAALACDLGASPPSVPWARFADRAAGIIALATLPSFAPALLAALPREVVSLLDDVRAWAPEAFVPDGGDFDECARTQAFATMRRLAPARVAEGWTFVARALEATAQPARALQFYTCAGAHAEMLRLLHTHGFALLEDGYADVVAAAIAALPKAERPTSAIALALQATDEAARGRYDISESCFEHALRLAPDERARMRIDVDFATALLRRGRPDAIERLEALVERAKGEPCSVLVLASLATAHATASRIETAIAYLDQALAALPTVGDLTIHTAVHQRAAFVLLSGGNIREATVHADLAANLARETGNDELHAVARSASYVVAWSHEDDHDAALDALTQIESAGVRLKNDFFRRFALIGSFLIAVERADDAMIAELQRRLAGEELEASFQHVNEGLLPAKALACGWSGDVRAAHAMLVGSAAHQTAPETRALRWAETALYATLADDVEAADHALDAAGAEIAATPPDSSVEIVRASLLIALAALVRGERDLARLYVEARTSELQRWPRWQTLARFVTMVATHGLAQPESLLTKLEAMHAAGLGGYARLIERIPAERLGLGVPA